MTRDPLYSGHGSKFFDNQYIYEEDLNNIEYSKLKTIRRSVAACLRQPGVAIDSLADSALKVEYVDSKHFTVNPGIAIDVYGSFIYVPDNISAYGSIIDDPDYHPEWPTKEIIAHGKTPSEVTRYYVNIYYNIQRNIIEADDEGVSQYTRVYDSYEIACEDFAAGSGSVEVGVCLGSFEVDTSGNIRFGEITDLRPLLQVLSEIDVSAYVPSSRRVFAQSNVASYLANEEAGNNYWAVTAGYEHIKTYTGYKHRTGSETMNFRFCVPNYSQVATNAYLYAYIYNCAAVLIASGSINITSNDEIKNLSLDISGLSTSVCYEIRVAMRTYVGTGTFYVRDLVIDVS